RDDDLEGPQHGEAAEGDFVQVIPDDVFENGHVREADEFRDADFGGETAQRGGGHASTTYPRDGRHPGIIPAGDGVVVDELDQLALGNDGVAGNQFCELVLFRQRAGQVEALENPIIQRPVDLEFERAD